MLNRTSRRSLLQSTGLLVAGSASPGLALLAGCAAPPAPMAETTMQEMTASDALSRIRSGKLSAEAYVGAMLDRAERLKGLDALISIDRDGAIAQAKKVDAMRAGGAALPVLAGLPIVVKDNINTQRPADHRRHRRRCAACARPRTHRRCRSWSTPARSSSPRRTCTSSPSASPAPTSAASPAR